MGLSIIPRSWEIQIFRKANGFPFTARKSAFLFLPQVSRNASVVARSISVHQRHSRPRLTIRMKQHCGMCGRRLRSTATPRTQAPQRDSEPQCKVVTVVRQTTILGGFHEWICGEPSGWTPPGVLSHTGTRSGSLSGRMAATILSFIAQ